MPQGKRIDYKSTASAPTLEIPPELTTPAYDERYSTTTASGAAAAAAAQASKPKEVLPANADAKLVRAGSQRWIVVKASQQTAWNTIRDFWTENGFVIASDKPDLGIMETDWAENRAVVPEDFVRRTIGKYIDIFYETYKRDKFRTRIERGTEPGTVEIYITHYGAEQMPTAQSQGTPVAFAWTNLPPNPELEAEFLQRLMVKFGVPTQQATQAIQTVAAAPDRARLEKDGTGSRLLVDDTFDRAWRRVGLALDRTGFTVVDRDRSKGLYFVRYADPDVELKKADKGILSKLQFWKSDEKEKPEQYRVVVTEAAPSSVVTVQDPAGSPERSPSGEKILALLKDQLK
jgi:outer membrane protein assembly factor BamC